MTPYLPSIFQKAPGEVAALSNGLLWWKAKGVGFYPVVNRGVYDHHYFEKYEGYAKTPMGELLTRKRIELVTKYIGAAPVVDIGIGCGQFVEMRGRITTCGYDVNPRGIRWLLDRGLWCDPYASEPDHVTCWDSLEHMKRPWSFLECVGSTVFVSLPIFRDEEHVVSSKHFRPDEHFWYFTRDGFVHWMSQEGFLLVEENRMEEDAGREDIGTFVFNR